MNGKHSIAASSATYRKCVNILIQKFPNVLNSGCHTSHPSRDIVNAADKLSDDGLEAVHKLRMIGKNEAGSRFSDAGRKIANVLCSVGMTQTDVANLFDVTPSAISQMRRQNH